MNFKFHFNRKIFIQHFSLPSNELSPGMKGMNKEKCQHEIRIFIFTLYSSDSEQEIISEMKNKQQFTLSYTCGRHSISLLPSASLDVDL
ncbi:CLUMA_CG008780, isoform A [Clunio marinus]|uniref:CLUMA_CG008780, isoform A n=1 Tax=Clunio marinus TaxID=568069 RepID=A0A1J1I8G2_9DIPT|nr:CLUMA_CG008780, isoform A [Clunio marinus]